MKSKKTYVVVTFIYLALLIAAFVFNLMKGYTHSLAMTFASLALLFVPQILFKLLKLKPVYEIYTLFVIFILMASLLGSSYRFYDDYAYWDKITHLFSGVLGTLFAYVLFCSMRKVRNVKREDLPLMYVFITAINLSIATLWELYEYLCLIVADYDAIRHYSTGVHDSMSDIASAIVGGLIAMFFIVKRYKTNKPTFVTSIYETFYDLNIKKESEKN